MKSRWMVPVILASGIIGSTAVASLTSESGLVLVGPLLMAVALLGVGVLQHRVHGASLTRVWAALIMAAAIVFGAVIVAQRDPARVASLLPVFGGALGVFIVVDPGTADRSDKGAGV